MNDGWLQDKNYIYEEIRNKIKYDNLFNYNVL